MQCALSVAELAVLWPTSWDWMYAALLKALCTPAALDDIFTLMHKKCYCQHHYLRCHSTSNLLPCPSRFISFHVSHLKVLKGHDDHVITCLQFCGNRIVSGSDDNTLKVWSAITGKVRVEYCYILDLRRREGRQALIWIMGCLLNHTTFYTHWLEVKETTVLNWFKYCIFSAPTDIILRYTTT